MNEKQYRELLEETADSEIPGKDEALNAIEREFAIEPVDPYEPVKAMCQGFDGSFNHFSDEYYDVLGLERE